VQDTASRLALIAGEPAGIGPELCVRLAQTDCTPQLLAIADGEALQRAAQRLGLPLRLLDEATPARGPGELALRHRPQAAEETPGVLDRRNAAQVIAVLHEAADAAQRGELAGLVTGPVHKGIINDAGIGYTGTTELLAQRAGVEVVMMLATAAQGCASVAGGRMPGATAAQGCASVAGGRMPGATDTLRVCLATTHLPLRDVPDAITRESLTRTLRIVDRALRTDFGLPTPRIAVLGLNPHAGEGGYLGREEIEVIEPVLVELRRAGLQLEGPLPADTAFLPMKLAQCDAVLAMYHDQGLPVLKHGGFERAVNITLGLPYVRVAVDHGTALELAGRGVADASSLILAARTAIELAQRRRTTRY
jgi:4-hydroxythreonine-4-phosphate dehydrogenase